MGGNISKAGKLKNDQEQYENTIIELKTKVRIFINPA